MSLSPKVLCILTALVTLRSTSCNRASELLGVVYEEEIHDDQRCLDGKIMLLESSKRFGWQSNLAPNL